MPRAPSREFECVDMMPPSPEGRSVSRVSSIWARGSHSTNPPEMEQEADHASPERRPARFGALGLHRTNVACLFVALVLRSAAMVDQAIGVRGQFRLFERRALVRPGPAAFVVERLRLQPIQGKDRTRKANDAYAREFGCTASRHSQ